MHLVDQASKGVKWSALTSGINALIGIAQISIVARFLEPVDFGAVAMIIAVLAIANVFVTVGFSDVLVVKHEATPDQLSTMYWLNVLVGILAYCFLFVSAPIFSQFIETEGIEIMVRVMGLTLLMGSFVVQFNALMRRDLHLKAVGVIGLVACVFGFATAVILASRGFGVWSLIMAGLVSQMITSLSLFHYAKRYSWLPRRVFNFGDVVEMMRFGIFRIAAALLNAVNMKSDQLVIGAFLSTTSLGLYTIAYNLAMQPFSRINPILTQVSFPVFAKIKNDNSHLLRGYRKGLRMLMAINAPLLLGLLAIAPLLIPALLGSGWEESIPILQILCLFVLLRSMTNINIGLILAKEKYRWPFYWNLLLVIIIPASVYFAVVYSHSLTIVSWVVVGIQLLLSIVAYVVFIRRLIGDFALGYLSDVLRPVLTAALMAFSISWLQRQVDMTSHWLGLAIMIPVGAVIYIALSFIIQRQHAAELIALVKAKM